MDLKEKLLNINLADFCNRHYNANFDLSLTSPSSRCIFHDDTNPSMMYNKNNNTIICWTSCYSDYFDIGQHKPINIFKVVAIKNGLDFRDKKDFVQILKDICSMEGIPYTSNNYITAEQYKLMEYKTNIARRYIEQIRSKDNANHMVHAYLINDRGLTKQTISDFYLGLTSNNEAKYGFSQMSNRVSIPIMSDDGKYVIDITGRQLFENEAEPKYKHGKTDLIWKKTNVLYAYSHAKEYCRESKFTYVVEGFFDVMSMHQIGLKNTVSMMSNMITKEQAEKLSTLSKTVVFILDQDGPGINAFLSNMKICMSVGLNVKVIPYLEFMGKDMNDVCIKMQWDKDKIKKFLENKTQDGLYFCLNEIYKAYDIKALELKKTALDSAMKIINSIQNENEKKIYKKELYKRIDM